VTLVLGGTFDPPHNGHLALLAGAKRHFGADRVLVLVVADPGHRRVHSPADVRLSLARLAFPDDTVELDEHPRTIDMLWARQLDDPVLVIGSDELLDFPTWKEPEDVLELARLAVGTRPGFEVPDAPERVIPFDMTPVPVSSTDIRRRAAADEPIDGLVPPAVAAEIERLGLYRDYTAGRSAQETEQH
jgi:nicotinate-nucleotide adenylyltransferase